MNDQMDAELARQDALVVPLRRIASARDRFERNKALRAFYASALPQLLEVPAHQWGMYPYEFDWMAHGTPIEVALWSDIREEGAVFYPQFPVSRYFVDFGNPVAKVAIECDGKAWHRDHEKDAQRQAEIEAEGWRVYRISGRDCIKDSELVVDDDRGICEYEPSPGQILIRRLSAEFGLSGRWVKEFA